MKHYKFNKYKTVFALTSNLFKETRYFTRLTFPDSQAECNIVK